MLFILNSYMPSDTMNYSKAVAFITQDEDERKSKRPPLSPPPIPAQRTAAASKSSFHKSVNAHSPVPANSTIARPSPTILMNQSATSLCSSAFSTPTNPATSRKNSNQANNRLMKGSRVSKTIGAVIKSSSSKGRKRCERVHGTIVDSVGKDRWRVKFDTDSIGTLELKSTQVRFEHNTYVFNNVLRKREDGKLTCRVKTPPITDTPSTTAKSQDTLLNEDSSSLSNTNLED